MTDYWGENNARVDCLLRADDITIMTSSFKKILHVFRIKFPTKHISDFLDLEN